MNIVSRHIKYKKLWKKKRKIIKRFISWRNRWHLCMANIKNLIRMVFEFCKYAILASFGHDLWWRSLSPKRGVKSQNVIFMSKALISVIWRSIIYMDRNNLVCCQESNMNVPMKIMFLSWTNFKLDDILFTEITFLFARQGSPNVASLLNSALLNSVWWALIWDTIWRE